MWGQQVPPAEAEPTNIKISIFLELGKWLQKMDS
jgi:hypothetical protein